MSKTEATTTLLEARDIHRSFTLLRNEVPVLRGIDLSVNEGETVSIMGASGAGKSTLLHIMGALDRPTKGTVLYQGRDIFRMSAARRTRWRARDVGFIFQTYHLLPELTLLENVMLPIVAAGGRMNSLARERSIEMLDRVGLVDRLDHTPTTLSGGEQQRAAIARALINDPEIIFADEPTGNLDTASGENILQCLLDMTQHAERALVMVTHNPDIAARCSRRFDLVDGVLTESASAI